MYSLISIECTVNVYQGQESTENLKRNIWHMIIILQMTVQPSAMFISYCGRGYIAPSLLYRNSSNSKMHILNLEKLNSQPNVKDNSVRTLFYSRPLQCSTTLSTVIELHLIEEDGSPLFKGQWPAVHYNISTFSCFVLKFAVTWCQSDSQPFWRRAACD
jgi:hypothetical protein